MKPSKNNKRFTLFDKIVLGLNIFVVVALLLSYLAPLTDPRDYDFIAILGFGYLYIAFGSLLFIFYWAFRKPIFILISLLPFLLGFSTMRHYFGFRGKSVQPQTASAGTLRVMQYNVHKFTGLDRFLDQPIQDEVFDLITNQNPDILTMVEFAKGPKKTDTLINQLKTTLKMNYYYKVFARGRDSLGNAIFSKYPILKAGVVDTTASMLNTEATFADILYNKKTIRVYSLHLAAVTMNDKQKKRFLKGSLFSFEKLFFIKDRISAANVYRSFQVDKIKTHIRTCPYPYIITGDFNDNPNSFSVNELSDGMKNAFLEKGSGFQTTYYSFFPLQIDYILVSPQFDVLTYKTIEKKMSDHKPVISDLKLN
jgi:endonuclease/exonuclease/phosphatase family metal-dependent hydrolase